MTSIYTNSIDLRPREAGGLRRRFRRAKTRETAICLALVLPLVLFVLIVFTFPIAAILFYAVDNREVGDGLPATVAALERWQGDGLPGEAVFSAAARDLADPAERRLLAEAARRLNYEIPGFRTLLLGSSRELRRLDETPEQWRAKLIEIDERWGEPDYWRAIKRAAPRFTAFYLLAAVDLKIGDDGGIERADPEQRIYLDILGRTLWISFVITALCLVIAFPVANLMVTAPPLFRTALFIGVLLPFWTSLLVRTSAWIVVLQREGLINDLLQWTRLISAPYELIFNRFGVYVAMVHILLPFTILPIYSVMKGIPPNLMRASASLGAHPVIGFLRVYIPMTAPGIGAGCLLTFIVAAGYYITPALVGGADDQMLSYYIAFFMSRRINWGMASALSLVLLICVLAVYLGIHRLVGAKRAVGATQ